MKKAAIEILIFNPSSSTPTPKDERGVVENPRIKQRFQHSLSVGVYLAEPDFKQLRYYFFDDCDNKPLATYTSLDELKEKAQERVEQLFEKSPKLFIMGHGHGGYYGLSNHLHGQSEIIHDKNFDQLITDIQQALSLDHGELFITLEGCNTDNQAQAKARGRECSFLESVSLAHPTITFGGTAPWDQTDEQTGYRGTTNLPLITSTAGNVWKAGNSVIFYAGEYQVAVRKSLFASTQSAKQLKLNTIECACAILGEGDNEEIIKQIALSREVLKIEDLKKVSLFPKGNFKPEITSSFIEQQTEILAKEQENYIKRVGDILARADSIEQLTDRDILVLTLGLKDPSVYDGHEDLKATFFENTALLQLTMVSCGKVLIGGPSNDAVIDSLLEHGIDINSADEREMTALHYAVENFFNYREEPLHLIRKLLECGAKINANDKQGRTPMMLAIEHCEDTRVSSGDKLIALLEEAQKAALKGTVRQLFQMDESNVADLLSRKSQFQLYCSCTEGTLYIPDNVVEKLQAVLQSLEGSADLLSAFESELNVVVSDLIKGKGTGVVLHLDSDERIPLAYDMKEIEMKFISVRQMLAHLRSEVASDTFDEDNQTFMRATK
jgi:hypothetical protein